MKFDTLIFLRCALLLGCLSTSTLAFAQQATDTPAPAAPIDQTHPVGGATRALLIMQSSNVSAAPAHAGGGEEASLAYRRYLDSFKHPIPTFFSSSTGKTNGASGGTAN